MDERADLLLYDLFLLHFLNLFDQVIHHAMYIMAPPFPLAVHRKLSILVDPLLGANAYSIHWTCGTASASGKLQSYLFGPLVPLLLNPL
ncbi:protein of unknown function [Pseudomonas inefficax]|uniref:Uncharacterized protein n=1 Tax=Pseudomonas inefficax TaxID=2078786 RepID=A0AAQ1PA41_9PSED|nr:protein of unknown function [Pseudomonas inefficax]